MGVVTQNVDGLHQRAGSSPVIPLHGAIADVVCLDLRPGDGPTRAAGPAGRCSTPTSEPRGRSSTRELRPDGDAVVDDWSDFVLADCLACGGVLKPDVVFFGESVPRDRVDQAYALVDAADVLVVLGSSLTVMSGFRFVRHNAKHGRDVVIVNRGATRGDDLATAQARGRRDRDPRRPTGPAQHVGVATRAADHEGRTLPELVEGPGTGWLRSGTTARTLTSSRPFDKLRERSLRQAQTALCLQIDRS